MKCFPSWNYAKGLLSAAELQRGAWHFALVLCKNVVQKNKGLISLPAAQLLAKFGLHMVTEWLIYVCFLNKTPLCIYLFHTFFLVHLKLLKKAVPSFKVQTQNKILSHCFAFSAASTANGIPPAS